MPVLQDWLDKVACVLCLHHENPQQSLSLVVLCPDVCMLTNNAVQSWTSLHFQYFFTFLYFTISFLLISILLLSLCTLVPIIFLVGIFIYYFCKRNGPNFLFQFKSHLPYDTSLTTSFSPWS